MNGKPKMNGSALLYSGKAITIAENGIISTKNTVQNLLFISVIPFAV
jgi:hypothetical protein